MKQVERFESWGALLKAVETKYTLSFRDACQMLKSSRTWVNRYIRPNVPCIYLSNGWSGRGQRGINWAAIAFKELKKDSIYFDAAAFDSFIRSSVVSCTKRAKRLYHSSFIPRNRLAEYAKACGLAYIEHEDAYSVWKKFTPNPALKAIEKALVWSTKRTAAPWVNVDLPPGTPISEWHAAHNETGYGDTAEMVYRQYFEEGKIRVELSFGSNSKKVFYIDDPEPTSPVSITDEEQEIVNLACKAALEKDLDKEREFGFDGVAEKRMKYIAHVAQQVWREKVDAFNVAVARWKYI